MIIISWTQDDEAVEAFAELIEALSEPLSNFNEKVWSNWVETKSDFLSLMFGFGIFVNDYNHRKNHHAGEDSRTTLHHSLNKTLGRPNIQSLLAKLGGQQIDKKIKGD